MGQGLGVELDEEVLQRYAADSGIEVRGNLARLGA